MRLPLYVLFNIGAMLSTLVTCHILKEALNLRVLVDRYLHGEIVFGSVTLTLDDLLIGIDPGIRSRNFPGISDFVSFGVLKRYLWDRQDGTHALRIIYESTDAIWRMIAGAPETAFKILRDSKFNDEKSGLSHQPIMKALDLRLAVDAFIASPRIMEEDFRILSNLLISIYPDDKPVNIMDQCSKIINNNSLDLLGRDSQRIPYESVVAFVFYFNGNHEGAREKLEESIFKDDDLEFTDELNNVHAPQSGNESDGRFIY
jgi:hypothetical protein